MLKRKLKKLVRDPKLFISDMIKNNSTKIKNKTPQKSIGHTDYTVVSAVYNVEKYLNDYFKSFINQNLNFKNNIHLILVDDGSKDSSSIIIKKWEKKYPKNITYIYKENGGQASARNLGLKSVRTEWVTFIDPDDFVNKEYFYNIDTFIERNRNKNLNMVSCNLIPYFEDINVYKDNHPLKYRYNNDNKLFSIKDLGKQIQLSASTAFFRKSIIEENNLEFDNDIKPSFEDAEFVASYLFNVDGYAGFLKNAKYYYRKRSDGSSTLDKAWESPGLYGVVLSKGCIKSMMRYIDSDKPIPVSLQITVLYHLIWYIKRLINNAHKLSFLSDEQIREFKENIYKIFSMIDNKTIIEFGLAGSWFYHKVGMLAQFKEADPDFQIVYIEAYDLAKEMVQLRYFTRNEKIEIIEVNGVDRIPNYTKTVSHDFLSESFVKERRIWVNLSKKEKINVKISNIPTTLSLSGKQKKDGYTGLDIYNHFLGIKPKYDITEKYKNCWLFMDREGQADDNAEHLYRYVKNNHKEHQIYFILQKTSHDWIRLKNEDFNLIDFGSSEHIEALKSCGKIISSHIDHSVSNYLGPKMLLGRHLIFLQHGITKDDLSGWLNQKEAIDCFITASKDEYNSICGENTRYKFTKKEVFLTGFPRHDSLVNNTIPKKNILIMPTWRSNIVGAPQKGGLLRAINPDFCNTDFFKKWSSLLSSSKLENLAKKHGYNVIFFPHVNITPYIDLFKTPSYIQVLEHSTDSIQKLFKESSLMITDYSSVAFEMAIQNKPSIYYQFDEDEVFSGAHTYSQGYYNYRKDGFGPVVTQEDNLIIELDNLLNNDAKPSNEIINRINSTFPLRDGNSCQRTYEAIISLDKSTSDDTYNIEILKNFAMTATHNKEWDLAIGRWNKFLHTNGSTDEIARLKLVEALREVGEINEAIDNLELLEDDALVMGIDLHSKEKSKLLMACNQWDSASKNWENTGLEKYSDKLDYIKCLSELQRSEDVDNYISSLRLDENECFSVIIKACQHMSHSNWQSAISVILDNIDRFTHDELISLKPELLLAKCYRKSGNYADCHDRLKSYEKYGKNDIQHRFEIAKLAYLQKNWKKVISQIDATKIKLKLLPYNLNIIYLESLRYSKNSSHVLNLLEHLPNGIFNDIDFKAELGENFILTKRWSEAAEIWIQLLDVNENAPYKLARVYRMLGIIEEGLSLLHKDGIRAPSDVSEWILRAELSQLSKNWSDASNCWSAILRYYPETAPKESWENLHRSNLLNAITSQKEKIF